MSESEETRGEETGPQKWQFVGRTKAQTTCTQSLSGPAAALGVG